MQNHHSILVYIPMIRSINPFRASAVACWCVNRKCNKSMAGKRATHDSSSSCGCELNVTDFRIAFTPTSADGQLARGITGGSTDNSSNGNPPPMLGVRCCFDVVDFSFSSFTTANSCLMSRGIDRSDDDVDDGVSSNFSNFPISISSAASSFLYTRFCTSTRYWSSRLSSIIKRRVLHSIFKPMLWITGSFIPPIETITKHNRICELGHKNRNVFSTTSFRYTWVAHRKTVKMSHGYSFIRKRKKTKKKNEKEKRIVHTSSASLMGARVRVYVCCTQFKI